MEVEIILNGRKHYVRDNITIFQAATEAGVYIPHFCYHQKLSIAANCRMCLVDVSKLPNPVPACATYVSDGMKISTNSARAQEAQHGVMEFLLVNHPLDCPICDQGGECQLQDLAVGYGHSCTRYGETKRVVVEKQLGPLITTAMTRCIHCTRCVRFGEEIAGTMELGMTGRGEHAEIMTFVGKTVDSELSGNMIDICPVGALNSKPFQFSARGWELQRIRGVSTHDSWNSYTWVQCKNGEVKRVLPRIHEEINQCWLSDRDRFAYDGVNSSDRLRWPMIVDEGGRLPKRSTWKSGLDTAVSRIRKAVAAFGPAQIGFLAGPQTSAEEGLLLARLARELGCENVDSRLRQVDFSADRAMQGTPWLGSTIHDLETLPSVLLVGCDPARELPLLPLRLRQAQQHPGVKIGSIGSIALKGTINPDEQKVVKPSEIARELVYIAKGLAAGSGKKTSLPKWLRAIPIPRVKKGTEVYGMSAMLKSGGAILLGSQAQLGSSYALLLRLCNVIAKLSKGFVGVLPYAGNSVGLSLAGVLPRKAALGELSQQEGLDAKQMIESKLKAYILFGCDPYDFPVPAQAEQAFAEAKTVISFDSYSSHAAKYADVMLPLATPYERHGSTVNLEGNECLAPAAAEPVDEAKEGWKILRMIGAQLVSESSFGFEDLASVRALLSAGGDFTNLLNSSIDEKILAKEAKQAEQDEQDKQDKQPEQDEQSDTNADEFERIAEVSHFSTDAVLRKSEPLQATAIARQSAIAGINPADLKLLGIDDGATAKLVSGENSIFCRVRADASIAQGCLRAAQGEKQFAGLGSSVSVQPAEASLKAA